MTAAPNPYAADLGNRDPLDALSDTPARIRSIVGQWSGADFERSYAPGKWSIRKVLIHLAQMELVLPLRVRFALSQEGYVAQPLSQDDWLPIDEKADALTAFGTYTTVRRFNVAMFTNLTAAQRERTFTHPEYGTITVWWVANQLAGHDLHHLKQIEAVG